jgi:hypothetical protein
MQSTHVADVVGCIPFEVRWTGQSVQIDRPRVGAVVHVFQRWEYTHTHTHIHTYTHAHDSISKGRGHG